jgi:hypothetical protein
MNHSKKIFKAGFLLLVAAFFTTRASWPQEEDLRFHTLWVKGNVTAYHNENDETARLYTNQTIDDGDKVTTANDSEAVLRVNKQVYLYLAPRTRIHVTRLRQTDKGFECQVNLVTGRMLCRMDEPSEPPLEVSAGSVLLHEHGTLFEVVRNGDDLTVVSYEGAVVAHLTPEEKQNLQSWQDLFAQISK